MQTMTIQEKTKETHKIVSLVGSFCLSLLPRPVMTIDTWSDKYRHLPRRASSEPGRWRTARFPFLKEIMYELSPSSPAKEVVVMKGSQLGFTENAINMIEFHIDYEPAPILYIQKTIEAVERFSKQRLQPSIDLTPVVADKIEKAKGRNTSNTIRMKEFPGGMLILGGANSAASLRSMPVRIIIIDEWDSFEADIDEEGDPAELAKRRAANFPNRKVYEVSTPGIKETSRIEPAFEEGDQRYFYVPCPFCGQKQVIRWENIHYKDEHGRLNYNKIYLECVVCKGHIHEHYKTDMLANGEWIAHNPDEGAYPSFHISALYSPLGFYSWKDAAKLWVKAQRTFSKELLKVFINTVLGETWTESGKDIDPEWVRKRKETYSSTIPAGVRMLTAGVDVQLDRLELELVGFGKNLETWSIDYQRFFGDPEQAYVWKELDKYLEKVWIHENGQQIGISSIAVDAANLSKVVYNYVRPREYRRVFAIKGKDGWGKGYLQRPKKRLAEGKVWLWIAYVDEIKSKVYSQLSIESEGAGYCHFPNTDTYDESYFRQLTAERLVTKKKKLMWELPPGRRNEALDCRVYAIVALNIIKPWFDLAVEKDSPTTMTSKKKKSKRSLSKGV